MLTNQRSYFLWAFFLILDVNQLNLELNLIVYQYKFISILS